MLNDYPEYPEHRTPRQILESIGKKLRKEFPILYIQYKTHARIPIIKIYTRRQVINGPNLMWNKFIADISVGNVLAIYNTRLVKAYTAVDERFKHLVLFCE